MDLWFWKEEKDFLGDV